MFEFIKSFLFTLFVASVVVLMFFSIYLIGVCAPQGYAPILIIAMFTILGLWVVAYNKYA